MLTVFTTEQSEEWDKIVSSFGNYDIYYMSGYVKAFELHGDGQALLFYYEDKNTPKTRAINVVMKRDIADDPHFQGKLEKETYFDFATPYGYGGWLIEGTETEALFAAYRTWCQKHAVVCEFVRYHPVLENAEQNKAFYNVIGLGNTIAMDLASPEVIWANIISKNRNMIRKAEKNGIRIYNGRYPEIYEKFRVIYNSTMDKDNAKDYYYFAPEFYQSILNDMPEQAQVFYAVLPDDTVIAASIMLAANGRLNYHLSGSLREYASLAPTNLLLYKAALWGSANGCKTLHLGGGVGSGEDSLFKFKRSFYRGDASYTFCIGKVIFSEETYQQLKQMRAEEGAVSDTGYFPEYRAN